MRYDTIDAALEAANDGQDIALIANETDALIYFEAVPHNSVKVGGNVAAVFNPREQQCVTAIDDDLKFQAYLESLESSDKDKSNDRNRLKEIWKAMDQRLLQMNKRFCFVNDNGTASVFELAYDELLGRKFYRPMRRSDIVQMYCNESICIGLDKEGQKVMQDVGSWWFENGKRRQYLGGTVFDPERKVKDGTKLNLWQGFAFTPKQGDWSLLRKHIHEIICAGDETLFDYVMGWCASAVQQPAKPAGVAIAMRGDKGVGKGILGNVMRRLFGAHGIVINSPKHLVGNFNAHLRDCILLFADEAFFAGDKSTEGTLKSLITEPVIPIEAKYRNTVMCRNMLHVMMASNKDWIVPASGSERRYLVLDVLDTYHGKLAYFDAIMKQMDRGGYAAMLYDLLHMDISKFSIRAVPDTAALEDQKNRSLSPEQHWLLDVLERGHVFESQYGLSATFGNWKTAVPTPLLYASYLTHPMVKRQMFPLAENQLGKFLAKLGFYQKRLGAGGDIVGERYNPHTERAEFVMANRPRAYHLGPLDEARAKFCKATKLKIDWDD